MMNNPGTPAHRVPALALEVLEEHALLQSLVDEQDHEGC